jgi:hypothetical protein
MSDEIDALILDLLEWVGGSRPYAEVLEVWRTSCPRLPVWEEANGRGYLRAERGPAGTLLHLTDEGKRVLEGRRPARTSPV